MARQGMGVFPFYFNTRITFGSDSRLQIADTLNKEGWKSVGVVVDANIAKAQGVRDVLEHLEKGGINAVVLELTISEPTYEYLQSSRGIFEKDKLDAIIGIGGGSALDTAKAMAVLHLNRQDAIAYRGFDKMTEPVLPIIAVPSTAGTGSEVTPNASFVDAVAKKKMGINGEAVRPRYAFLDPVLTLTCPRNPTLSAGADSMVHAVEAYAAKKSTPMARLMAAEGFRRVFGSLARVLTHPDDLAAREEVMYGAFLSGIALMNSGTGPAAAMSYPLGVHFKVPHGIGGAIFLPHVVCHNVNTGCAVYGEMFRQVWPQEKVAGDAEAAKLFSDRMTAKWDEMGVSKRLADYGVQPQHVAQFVADTMELKGALDQNPVPFYEKEITAVLAGLGVK